MGQAYQCRGEKPQSPQELETGGWGKGKEEQDNGQRTSPGPQQIKSVNSIDLILEPGKGEANTGGRTKKWYGEQQVKYQ
jgi:hypothetical protein